MTGVGAACSGAVKRSVFCILVLLTCGCQTMAVEQAAYRGPVLPDSDWTLIEYQSATPDSASFTLAPNKINLRLDASGAARFKFDCNRGSANWNAEPANARNGLLSFGEVASTTALCPSGSHGEEVAQNIGKVTSYQIDDGRLTMTMKESRGIYVWEVVD